MRFSVTVQGGISLVGAAAGTEPLLVKLVSDGHEFKRGGGQAIPLAQEVWEATPLQSREFIVSLMGQVATLTQQVLTLQKRLEAMEELTRTNSTNSSKPPSADPPGTLRNRKETSGKSRGGQPGHKGYHQYTLVGECKWTNRPIGMTEWQKLRDKAQVLTQEIPLYYLFSRSGFSPELRDQTQVRCVGLEELLETVPH